MILALIYLIVLSLLLGYSITWFIKREDTTMEKVFTCLMLGLALFPILSVVMSIVHIPIIWWLFLLISIIVPIYSLFRTDWKFSANKGDIYLGVAVIFAVILAGVFVHGAFTYPYMEDDDSWDHGVGTSYVGTFHTASRSFDPNNFQRMYLEPYPPAYDILMGTLYQIDGSVKDTLKFFNAVLCGLAILFAYLFFERFLKSRNKAIVASLVLLVLPSFMSHFIWAQTLAVLLFFPAFYCLERLQENKLWLVGAIISIASLMVTQPSSAVIFGVFFVIYLVFKFLCKQDWKLIFLSGLFGVIASLLYWVPTFIKYGWAETMEGIGMPGGSLSQLSANDTSGGIVYKLMDFLFAPLSSKMDQPVGIGLVLCLFAILGLVVIIINFKKNQDKTIQSYPLIVSFWFIFCLVGVEGNLLPVKLFPHRFWVFLAIPLALLVAEGFVWLMTKMPTYGWKVSVSFVLLLALIGTSAYPKYVVETSFWPPGTLWYNMEELQAYMGVKQLSGSVMPLCSEEEKVIGFDGRGYPDDPEIREFRNNIRSKTWNDLVSLVDSKKPSYIAVDPGCITSGRLNVTEFEGMLSLLNNQSKLVYQNNVFWLFGVK